MKVLCPAVGLWFVTGLGNDIMNNAIILTSVVGNTDKRFQKTVARNLRVGPSSSSSRIISAICTLSIAFCVTDQVRLYELDRIHLIL